MAANRKRKRVPKLAAMAMAPSPGARKFYEWENLFRAALIDVTLANPTFDPHEIVGRAMKIADFAQNVVQGRMPKELRGDRE